MTCRSIAVFSSTVITVYWWAPPSIFSKGERLLSIMVRLYLWEFSKPEKTEKEKKNTQVNLRKWQREPVRGGYLHYRLVSADKLNTRDLLSSRTMQISATWLTFRCPSALLPLHLDEETVETTNESKFVVLKHPRVYKWHINDTHSDSRVCSKDERSSRPSVTNSVKGIFSRGVDGEEEAVWSVP